ncbi:hypothetical protein JDV02_005693 [Purpureocillium takamizusanense]|uniref:Uncharacterized protein n=1 Tax=Purpureocillium takamizusanense TaxID=2060973 RepID=A0A9Q8QHZ4_9HYPO|nr:uncharacterized protein JDV02_005693 [Purpureocillium takamizusanense]UNI19511.1 hypothetical protein JDV02_005693 [Purpureocillium takamizusanense]
MPGFIVPTNDSYATLTIHAHGFKLTPTEELLQRVRNPGEIMEILCPRLNSGGVPFRIMAADNNRVISVLFANVQSARQAWCGMMNQCGDEMRRDFEVSDEIDVTVTYGPDGGVMDMRIDCPGQENLIHLRENW